MGRKVSPKAAARFKILFVAADFEILGIEEENISYGRSSGTAFPVAAGLGSFVPLLGFAAADKSGGNGGVMAAAGEGFNNLFKDVLTDRRTDLGFTLKFWQAAVLGDLVAKGFHNIEDLGLDGTKVGGGNGKAGRAAGLLGQ